MTSGLAFPSSVCKGRQQLRRRVHSSGTPLLTRMFFLSLFFSLVSELPIFLGKACYCFLRHYCFCICREAGLYRTRISCFHDCPFSSV